MHVSQLYIHPVKSLGAVSVQRAQLSLRGFVNDRRWMVVNESGRLVSQRDVVRMATAKVRVEPDHFVLEAPGAPAFELPAAIRDGRRMPVEIWRDRVEAIVYEPSVDWVSQALGFRGWLVYMPDDVLRAVNPKYGRDGDIVSFADGYPLLVITQASLHELNRRLAVPVTMARFRPSVVVTETQPFEEDTWERVRIGDVTFRGPKGCDRCSVVTIDPENAKTGDVEPLRTLATFRARDGKVWFGMNLIPEATGELHVGDSVTAIAAPTH